MFVVGQTYSGNPLSAPSPLFPGTASCGAFGQSNVGKNASTNQGFISKLTGSGSAIDWSCYVEGKNNADRVARRAVSCELWSARAARLPGLRRRFNPEHSWLCAQDFPITANAFQSTLKGTNSKSNATFLVFHPDGSMLDYGTYYGGTGNGTNADAGIGVAVDSSGNGYITGATYSTDLVTMNPAISTFQGTTNTGANAVSNAFVAEFNPTAANGPASLIYATYLGGSGATGTITLTHIGSTSISVGDVGTGIAIDSNNKIWVTGLTASTNFPLGSVGTPFQSTNNAGTSCGGSGGAPNPNAPATAGYVEKLDTSFAGLNQIRYGTYFGGCGIFFLGSQGPVGGSGSIGFGDASLDIALAGSNVYITGVTTGGMVANSFPLSTNVKACTHQVRTIQKPELWDHHRQRPLCSAHGLRDRAYSRCRIRARRAHIFDLARRDGRGRWRYRHQGRFQLGYRSRGAHLLVGLPGDAERLPIRQQYDGAGKRHEPGIPVRHEPVGQYLSDAVHVPGDADANGHGHWERRPDSDRNGDEDGDGDRNVDRDVRPAPADPDCHGD